MSVESKGLHIWNRCICKVKISKDTISISRPTITASIITAQFYIKFNNVPHSHAEIQKFVKKTVNKEEVCWSWYVNYCVYLLCIIIVYYCVYIICVLLCTFIDKVPKTAHNFDDKVKVPLITSTFTLIVLHSPVLKMCCKSFQFSHEFQSRIFLWSRAMWL